MSLDNYEPIATKPRLKALDWYQIHSLYRQYYTDNQLAGYRQVLVQYFSIQGSNSDRNNLLMNWQPSRLKYTRNSSTSSPLISPAPLGQAIMP
jgi:hypothetical protein